MTTLGNVARCKVARGYVAARYCRHDSVAEPFSIHSFIVNANNLKLRLGLYQITRQ